MPKNLSTFFAELSGRIGSGENNAEREQLLDNIDNARREWLLAYSYFNQVSDPDLVDMAIYSIEAAEKKYVYLLKLAKLKGVTIPYPEQSSAEAQF